MASREEMPEAPPALAAAIDALSGPAPADARLAQFAAAAHAAINESVLIVNGQHLRVLEVEFYLHDHEHPDDYTHCAEEQRRLGQWYWHREAAARIGFTLKGVDLTFGGGAAERYGGMLLRAAGPVDVDAIGLSKSRGVVVEGPSKLVDLVLQAAGVTSVAALKRLDEYRTSDEGGAFGGVVALATPASPLLPLVIHSGPRVGLKGARPFAAAPYRFRAIPHLTKNSKASLHPHALA